MTAPKEGQRVKLLRLVVSADGKLKFSAGTRGTIVFIYRHGFTFEIELGRKIPYVATLSREDFEVVK